MSRIDSFQPGSRPALGSCEACDSRMLLGQSVRPGTLRAIVRATEANRERSDRRSIMRAARAARAASIDAARRAIESLDIDPLASLMSDIDAGLVQRDGFVTETFRVQKGNRHEYFTVSLRAAASMVALERLYRDYSSHREAVEASMREPRGGSCLPRVASTVNAPSIRASRKAAVSDSFDARPASERGTVRPYGRVQFSRDVSSGKTRAMGDCLSVTVTGSRHMSDGFRRLCATERLMRGEGSVFVASGPETPRKRSRKATAAPSRAAADIALQASMGTVHDAAA